MIWKYDVIIKVNKYFKRISWRDFNIVGWSWKIKDENIFCFCLNVKMLVENIRLS